MRDAILKLDHEARRLPGHGFRELTDMTAHLIGEAADV